MDSFKHLVFIGFELIVAAVVITMVFFGLEHSRTILSSGIDTAVNIQHTLDLEFSEAVFSKEGKSMPAASCYVLLAPHSDIISECKCDVCGTTAADASCLKGHLAGRVKVAMTDNKDGSYKVRITG